MSERISLTLRADARGFTSALKSASGELDKTARKARSAGRRIEASGRSFHRLERDSHRLAGSLSRVHNRLISVRSALIGLGGAVVIRGVYDAVRAFQQFENRLLLVTGSLAGARAEFERVQAFSDRIGADAQASAAGYSKFAVAASQANLELTQIRKVFMAVARAGVVNKLSAQQQRLAYMALEQMVSKGRVSMEELRRQLGDQIPGAMQIAAASMNMTTSAFMKAVENGEIMARDLLPKLAEGFDKAFGPALGRASKSVVSEMNRLNNAIFEVKLAASDSGALDAMTNALISLSTAMRGEGFKDGIATISNLMAMTTHLVVEYSGWISRLSLSYGAARVSVYAYTLAVRQWRYAQEAANATAARGVMAFGNLGRAITRFAGAGGILTAAIWGMWEFARARKAALDDDGEQERVARLIDRLNAVGETLTQPEDILAQGRGALIDAQGRLDQLRARHYELTQQYLNRDPSWNAGTYRLDGPLWEHMGEIRELEGLPARIAAEKKNVGDLSAALARAGAGQAAKKPAGAEEKPGEKAAKVLAGLKLQLAAQENLTRAALEGEEALFQARVDNDIAARLARGKFTAAQKEQLREDVTAYHHARRQEEDIQSFHRQRLALMGREAVEMKNIAAWRDRLLASRPGDAAEINAIAGERKRRALLGSDYTRLIGAHRRQVVQEQRRAALIDMREEGDITASQFQEEMERVRLAELEQTKSWQGGVERALIKLNRSYADHAAAAERAVTGAFQSMTDSLVEFTMKGRLDFRSFANSIIADMLRMQYQEHITGPLAQMASSFLGSFFGGGAGSQIAGWNELGQPVGKIHETRAGTYHTGGIVGELNSLTRRIAPHVFNTAQHYHRGGLLSGEVPVIAKRGEGIFTPKQMDNADQLMRMQFQNADVIRRAMTAKPTINITVAPVIDARGAEAGVEDKVRNAVAEAAAPIVREAVNQALSKVHDSAARGGTFAKMKRRRG